ncbi:Chromo domain-containing protein [Mycena chlorophos]|uniref:Chromo domain-containing protein n=1 Tax=Mycena chlorophos TaxID=658473 RepID=A0A8H6WHB9_MYCCL|nr:Chromo domain-containing protein [Mycena chlorophos]
MAPKKRKTKGRGRTSTRTALPGFDPSTSAFVLKDSEERWFVEVILAARRCRTPRSSQTEYKPMHDGGRWEYLVKWAGFSEDDNTWEPATSLLSCARLVHSFWSRFPIHTDGHETYFCKGDKAGLLLTPPSDWIEREKVIFQTLANEQDVAKQNADPLNHAREAILELLPRHLFQTPVSDLNSASAVGGPSTITHESNAAFDDAQSQSPLAPSNGNNYLRWNPTQVRQHARLYGHHWQQNPDQHALRVDPEGDFDSKLGDFGALTLGMDDGVLEGAARLGGHDVAPKSSPTEAKMPQPQPLVAQPSHTSTPPPTSPVHDSVDDGDGDTTMLDASVSQSQSQSQPESDPITTDVGDDIPPPNTSVSSTTPSTANALPVAAANPTHTPHRSDSLPASAGSNVVDIDVPCTAMEWGQVCSLLLESGSERHVQSAEQAEAGGAGVGAAHDDGDQDVSELPRARDPAVTPPKSIPVAPSPPMSPETSTPIVFGQPRRLLLPQPQPDPQPQPNLQTQTEVPAVQIQTHDVVDQPRPSKATLHLPGEPVPPNLNFNPEPNIDIDIEVDKRDEGQVARELVPSADEASPTPSPSTGPALALPVLVEYEQAQAQAQACITEDLSSQQKDVTDNEIVVAVDETRLQHAIVLLHDAVEDTQLEQPRSRVAEESFPSHKRDETPTPPASVGPTSMPTSTPAPMPMPMATSTSDETPAGDVAGQEDDQDVAMMSTTGGEEEEEETVKLESMEVMVEGEGQLEEYDELQEQSSDDTMVVDQPQVDSAITANAPQPSAASVVPTSNTNPVPIPNPFPSYPKPSTTPRDLSLPPITTFSRPSYFASSLSSPSTSSSSPISPVSLSPLPLSPTAHTVPSTSESLSLPPTLLPSPHVSQKRKREHVPVPAPIDPTREPRRPKAPRTGSRIKLLDSSVGASLPGARGRTDVVSVAGNARKRMIGERAYASGLLSTERGERDVEMDGVEQALPQPQPTTPTVPVSSIWSPSTDDWSNWSTPYPLAEPRNIPAATGTGRRAEMDVDADAETRFEVHSGSWSSSYASTSPTTTSTFKTGSWIPSQTAGFGFARPKAQTQAEPMSSPSRPRQDFHVAGGNNVPLGWSSVSSARPSSSSSSSGWSSTEAVKKDWFARGTTNKDRNSTTNDHIHTPASHTTRKDAHWPSLSTFAETSRNAMPTVTSSTHTNTTTKTTNASTFRWPSLSEFV